MRGCRVQTARGATRLASQLAVLCTRSLRTTGTSSVRGANGKHRSASSVHAREAASSALRRRDGSCPRGTQRCECTSTRARLRVRSQRTAKSGIAVRRLPLRYCACAAHLLRWRVDCADREHAVVDAAAHACSPPPLASSVRSDCGRADLRRRRVLGSVARPSRHVRRASLARRWSAHTDPMVASGGQVRCRGARRARAHARLCHQHKRVSIRFVGPDSAAIRVTALVRAWTGKVRTTTSPSSVRQLALLYVPAC